MFFGCGGDARINSRNGYSVISRSMIRDSSPLSGRFEHVLINQIRQTRKNWCNPLDSVAGRKEYRIGAMTNNILSFGLFDTFLCCPSHSCNRSSQIKLRNERKHCYIVQCMHESLLSFVYSFIYLDIFVILVTVKVLNNENNDCNRAL